MARIFTLQWSELIRIFTWKMVWIDQNLCIINGLNWSGFLHGKWSEYVRWQMVWIEQDFNMAYALNWPGFFFSLKMIELIRVCKWKIVCIDLDYGKWSELIWIFTWKMVWIDLNFYMANGLTWLGVLHGKHPTSEKLKTLEVAPISGNLHTEDSLSCIAL